MIITNDLRDDGFGAQYQSILWSILFAEVKGHDFVYTRIGRMHNDEEDTKKFIQDAEAFMNIKGNYTSIDTVYQRKEQTVYALKAPFFFAEIEKNMDAFHSTPSFDRLQKLYFENKTSPFDDQYIHVAVHIRRPVKFDIGDYGTQTPHSYFLAAIKDVISICENQTKSLLFHIYSQGKPEDFSEYANIPHKLHLEDNTFDTFLGMTFAHILIISPSSYSYTAALLSKGLVIYYPFWHPPLKNWIIVK